MLRSDQPGQLCSGSRASPAPPRARDARQEIIAEGSGGAGVWGLRRYLRTGRPKTRVGGARGATAAAPTDDVTERPSRESRRGGCSRALAGRRLGRIMEADSARAPDSVSALVRPWSPFFLLVPFPPPCFLASLPPLGAPGRGGGPQGCSSFHRRGCSERVCWCLRRPLRGLDASPPPLRVSSGWEAAGGLMANRGAPDAAGGTGITVNKDSV